MLSSFFLSRVFTRTINLASHYSEDMKPLKFPQSWHDLNTAVDSGAVKLVAAPAALTKYLIFTYAITVACFVGLCLYYNLFDDK